MVVVQWLKNKEEKPIQQAEEENVKEEYVCPGNKSDAKRMSCWDKMMGRLRTPVGRWSSGFRHSLVSALAVIDAVLHSVVSNFDIDASDRLLVDSAEKSREQITISVAVQQRNRPVALL